VETAPKGKGYDFIYFYNFLGRPKKKKKATSDDMPGETGQVTPRTARVTRGSKLRLVEDD
jgi:hypothetical protein